MAISQKPTWLHSALSLASGRSNRILRILIAIGVVMLIIRYSSLDLPLYQSSLNKYSVQSRTLARAGNSTLGFSSIEFINLKHRFDRLDAATLQAYLSGLDISEAAGVQSDDIHDAGMPPTHRIGVIRDGEKGCWRAHANIWSRMLRDKSPAVLIIESDAAWDINIRDIMSTLNPHFTDLLRRLDSKPIPDAAWNAGRPHNTSHDSLQLNPNDPWHSRHWDMLSFGQCFESSVNSEVSLSYPDKHVTEGKDYFGQTLGHDRVVRLSGGIVCTTAYAVSRTGAAKLLLRSAVDLDNPVDLLMRRMTLSGDLIVYSVMPTVFAQWEYVEKIGMTERGANSDINSATSDAEIDMTGWADVEKTGSVWQDKQYHPDIAFENMALEKAWSLILPNASLAESQYHEDEGN
ncbi:hypothetical protein H634G_08044 [Metarhizium anisopliae BRIP 53293]|uniref:Glycosyl transferase family 25 domain-containing protein n=1 Tax=Metarhizium anisopliae BRIP 53293 TaxID=1291518 RepID=A0A0D9NSG3_METAN|nr:hypothetical protein H634G_08044 [Metarhizium anisopliae BRIP 53293]KJK89658.1 hypothetical protein H633G_06518 [Metarhizium anisopliae BRIP 53284]